MSRVELNADVRPLTHRIAEDCEDLIAKVTGSDFAQHVLGGTVTLDQYGALLAQLAIVHRRLDDAITTIRDQHAELASLVPDSRLFAAIAAADVASLSDRLGTPAATDAIAETASLLERIDQVTEFEPFKLIGLQFAREGMRNVDRYLAKKLRAAFGDADNERAGYGLFDGYGLGQRPIWERFRRDMDKLVLSEPEKQSIVAGSRLYLDSLAAISHTVAERPAGEAVHRVPVTL